MPAACQSSLLHPSTFAFRGCEGAKRQRLCRPSGNPVGVNLAGVSLFRMRAHGWRWGLWRAFGTADAARCCSRPLRSPNQCLLLAKASCFTRPPLLLRCQTAAALPTKWQPVGPESCWGFPVSDACSRVTLGAVTCLWNDGWCRTVLLKAVTSAQPINIGLRRGCLHTSVHWYHGSIRDTEAQAELITRHWPC